MGHETIFTGMATNNQHTSMSFVILWNVCYRGTISSALTTLEKWRPHEENGLALLFVYSAACLHGTKDPVSVAENTCVSRFFNTWNCKTKLNANWRETYIDAVLKWSHVSRVSCSSKFVQVAHFFAGLFQSFDDCVEMDLPECTSINAYFRIIPFFCGQYAFCR